MATAVARRLEAEAAQGRRGEQREREKREAAEKALADLQRSERLQQHVDAHPSIAPSADGLAAWEAIRERMRSIIDAQTWRIWCEPIHPHRQRDGVWVLACPKEVALSWVVERFHSAWEWACGGPVKFVICDQSTTNQRSNDVSTG
jgi:hypothetical protein